MDAIAPACSMLPRLLITGYYNVDTVRVTGGSVVSHMPGGSAFHAALSASHFVRPAMICRVGNDLPEAHHQLLGRLDIDVSAMAREDVPSNEWIGAFNPDTGKVRCTRFIWHHPGPDAIPGHLRDIPYLFLGAQRPKYQNRILFSLPDRNVATLDCHLGWIHRERMILLGMLPSLTALILTDAEAGALFKRTNVSDMISETHEQGVPVSIIKHGALGATFSYQGELRFTPAYRVSRVADPVGAGDTLAGGFMGALVQEGQFDSDGYLNAFLHGMAMSSFNVEGHGPYGVLYHWSPEEFRQRLQWFWDHLS